MPDVSEATVKVVPLIFPKVGFGYEPVRSPPAVPPGVVPVIVTLPETVEFPESER